MDDAALCALRETGIAYLTEDAGFFTAEEWQRIEAIAASPHLPLERVVIGDAGEANDVRVGRFVTDVERPLRVNEPLASALLDIIHSPARADLHRRLLGSDGATLRRAQLNILTAGSYIGRHLDTDSNPDYGYSIVLQLGTDYAGGDFAAYEGHRTVFCQRPARRSVLITRSDIPHEVKPVTGGERISLVYFLSAASGDNRRAPETRRESVVAGR